MKKLLPVLLIVLYGFAGCKKEKNTPADPVPATNSTAALTYISADIVTAGMAVGLGGSGLPASASAIKVYFNGVEATVQNSSPGGMNVVVPVTTSGTIKAVIDGQTITGPSFTYVKAPAITAFTPMRITAGTVVTITGTDLQAAGFTTTVSFGGVAAVIQSISPTEIKVTTPLTGSGKIQVAFTPQIAGLSEPYSYTTPNLLAPYVTGSVGLGSQSDVDIFAEMNKGRNLQIMGDLDIRGQDITSLSALSIIRSVSGQVKLSSMSSLSEAAFLNTLTQAGSLDLEYLGLTALNLNSLQGFSGTLTLGDLAKLNRVSFTGLATPAYVSVYNTPLLRDMGFLNTITSTGSITLINTGAASLQVDRLTTIGSISLTNCPELTTLSLRALSSTTGTSISGINFTNMPALTNVDLRALTKITGTLLLSGTGLANMNGFGALSSTGTLRLVGNDQLADLQGLKSLTAITLPAVTSGARGGSVMFNGIEISINPKLASLNGLQNITSLPMLSISGNTILNDLCPFKKQLLVLNALPAYVYKYTPCCDAPLNYYVNGSKAALTLGSNGNYTTQQEALDALAQCP